jgi:putative addiction module component (TIGR02574 family)
MIRPTPEGRAMTVDLKALGLDKLTKAEKKALAKALMADVKGPAEIPPGYELTDAQRAELDRRIADLKANPDDYVTWEEVQASVRKRLGI